MISTLKSDGICTENQEKDANHDHKDMYELLNGEKKNISVKEQLEDG